MGTRIELFACVETRAQHERKNFVESLKTYGIEPQFLDNKIEFRYTGSRDLVSRLIAMCDAIPAHSIHVSAAD